MRTPYLVLLLLLVACVPATEPDPPTTSGTWATFIRLEGRERASSLPDQPWLALRCEGGIVTVLDDVGGTINGGFTKGSLACWFDADPVAILVPWASPIEGWREGHAVTLDDQFCLYQGQLLDAHTMSGTVRCDRDSGSTELDLTGTWEATR